MLLSIGMIVKNEERTLDACLKSLDSLRKNVDCELIIADTGSTDSTKEIAAKYADILFDFAWCNDFAAARNSTIDRATGDWYMFLDTDEIFEDTADIEEFFQSGEYLKYKKEQESNVLILLNCYIEAIILYTHAIDHPDLLQDDRVTDLPAPVHFAYYVEQAQCADQSEDELGYYRNMTQAIDQYKVIAKPMKLLINYHREELENKKKQLLQNNQELTELAAQVKKQLYLFVEQKTIPRQKKF